MATLKFVIFAILFISTISAQSFVQISANPNEVQSRNAEITISFALSKALAVDDTIRLIFPPDTITVSQELTNCVETDNRLQFKTCRAEVQNNTIYLKLGTAIKLEGTSTASYSIKIQKAINLPTTNATVQDIKLFTKQNETRFTTYQARIGRLQSTTLTPAVQIVGADTSLQLQFTTSHITPKKGKIHLKVQAPWNDGAITQKIDYFGSISCNQFSIGGISVLGGTYNCLFLDKNRVEITGGFPDSPQPSGVQIQIIITGFKNPIRANYDFQVFEVYTTGDDINNFIDYSQASIIVTDAAELITPAFQVSTIQEVNIGIVQESNMMELKFGTPVPLVQNCTVSYWFPTSFYNAEQITQIRTGSLLTRIRTNYKPAQDPNNPQTTEFVVATEEDNNFKSVTFFACPEFSNQDVSETTRIEGLTQPLSIQPTASLRIYIRDGAGQLTAFINKSLSFIPEPGQLLLVSASITPQKVSSQSFVNVIIQPQHSLRYLLQPSITIKMPNDFQVQNEQCYFQTELENLNFSAICESSVVENTLTVYNFLSQNLLGDEQISFQVGPVKLPETVAGGKGQLKIGTYLTEITDNPSGLRYQVDYGTGIPDFQILEGTFLEVGVEVAEKQAFLQTNYAFKITPEHVIPQYGIIMVEYPPQVNIQDPSLSQALCSGWENFPSVTAVCQIFTKNRTIIITKGFHAGDGIEKDEQDLQNLNKKSYSWTVPFVSNPSNLLETQSFTFRTFDQNFNLIDKILSGATIKMNDPSKFQSEVLTLGSYVNAEVTSYQFLIVMEIPVKNGYTGVIKFAPENQLAFGAIICSSPTTDYINRISCQQSLTDQKIVILQFYLSKQIPALETFVITVNGIQNPLSTKASKVISLSIFSDISLANLIAIDNGSLFAKTYVPYSISESRVSLSQSVQGAGLPSNITITAQIVHDLLPSSGILIRYPPQLIVDENQGLKVAIYADTYGYPDSIIDPEIDYSQKQILFQDLKFTNGLQVNNGMQKLIIEIQGFSNPYNNEKSQSFQIVTFNSEDNVLYLVDQVSSGLTINSICNFPCRDCATGKPSQCLSCFMETSLAFLEGETCLEKCSDGYYFEKTSLSCKKCNQNCLTCSENSGNCLSCGGNKFPLLRNNDCVSNCGDGFIDDPSNNICLPCRSGCSSCSKSVNNCTSCDLKSDTPLYFNFDCVDVCPFDISVLERQINSQPDKCIPCSTSCNTCFEKVDFCTSCVDYKRLDPLNYRCLDACVQNSQIYNKDTGQCDTCSVNCESCSGNPDRCTKCKSGFVLTHDNTCEPQCTGSRSQIIIDQKCTECKDPCDTCDGQPDVCTSCFDDVLLYKSTCVDHCPDKYEPNNGTINQCILRGLICTEGFHINIDGEGCIPNAFQCDKGYTINEKKTACIPAPGQPIPFPFLFFAFCMSLVVAGSHLKERSITKVYSSLIMLLSSTELLQAILIAIKAASLEQPEIAALGFIATVTAIIGNLIFVFIYKKYIYQDSNYYDWIRLQFPLRIVLPFLMAIINFKIIRFVFSGLFNLSFCQAQFSKPIENVHKWIQILTIFNFLVFQIPLLIANLLILQKIGWGQQLLVLGIETLILQIIITLLTIKEFINPHTLYPFNNQYELLPKKKPIKIKNTIDDYEKIDEKKIIRQDKGRQRIEIDLRRTALLQILKQIDPNFLNIDEKNKQNYLKIETVNRQQESTNSESQQTEKFIVDKDGLRKVSSCHNFSTNLKKQKAKKKFKGTSTREEGSSGSVLGKDVLTQEDYDSEDGLSNKSNDFDIDITKLVTKKDPKYLILGTLSSRRNSFPFLNENIRKQKENKHFFQEVEKLRQAIEDEKYRDNCYYDLKPELLPPPIDPETGQPKEIHIRKKKLVNRRTQTYLRELLWLEGEEKLDSDLEIIMEDDIDLSDGFVGNLINGVIDGLSQSSEIKTANLLSRRSRPGKKKKEQPKFELQDILGDFDLDNEGNYIMIQENNDLLDKKGRLVNLKGYLIDKKGNVITANGQIAFKTNELDTDGEIPATFVFAKHNLPIPENLREKQTIVHDQDEINYLDELHKQEQALLSQEEDEIIAKEMSEFRQVIKAVELSISDSRAASQILQKKPPSKQMVHYEESDNIEQMLDLITKKHIPIRSTEFFSSKVEPNSKKKQKPPEKKQLRLETSPVITRKNDKKTSNNQLQVANQGKVFRGQSEDGLQKSIKSHDKKNLQRIADMLIGMADQVADPTTFTKQARPDTGKISASSMQPGKLKPTKLSGKGSDVSKQFGLNTTNKIQFVSIFGQNNNEDFTRNQQIVKQSPDRSFFRVYSGDPKLRDLENIYLPKEQKAEVRNLQKFENNQDRQAILLADNIERIEQELKMHTFDDRITASWNKDQINRESFENYTKQDQNTQRVNQSSPKI